jgi:hypothetical protein
MTKKLARLLRADIQETSDLKSIAKMLANKGRGGDTVLAHITPKEINLLKEAGGAGTVNPETGLLEFYDGFDTEGFEAPAYQIPQQYSYGSDYAEAQPAQVGTQDFYYQPSTPVELTPPESYAPTPSPYETSIPYTQSMVAETQPYTGKPSAAESAATFPGVSPIAPEARQVVAAQQDAIVKPTPPSLLARTGDVLSAIKSGGGDVLDYLKKNPDLLRIGGAGAAAIVGRQQSQKAAEQVKQATQEQKNLGAPYQQTGTELQRAAMSGELTPQGAQAYQAMRAQMAQGVESRGGVGVAQAQAQVEAFRQQLLANQYNLGLQVSQIGDNIALGAIRTGMQLDQQLNQANQQFYTQLAAIAGGGTYGYQPPRTTGAPQ